MGEGSENRITPRSRLLLIGLAAAVMFVCYAVLVSLVLNPKLDLVYNVRGATYGGPLTWIGRWLHLSSLSSSGRLALYLPLMIVLAACYLFAAYLVRDDRRKIFVLLVGGGFLLFALLFLFTPPYQTRDVFSYSIFGRVMSVYGKNPYVYKPAAFPNDLIYPLVGWKDNASVYGPFSNSICGLITKAAGNSISSTILGFKISALALYAACLPIVYSLTKRVAPGRENLALLLTAWNPLMILHILGGGHNESWMVFFVLLGFWLYRRGQPMWGIVSIILAVTIKFTAGFALVPLLLLYLRESRGSVIPRAVKSLALVIFLTALIYLPYWQGLKIFETTRKMSGMYSSSSVQTLARNGLIHVFSWVGITGNSGINMSTAIVRLVFWVIFIGLVLLMLYRVKDFKSMVLATSGIFLAWFFTQAYILPWYLLLGLAVVVITGWNATTGCTVAASVVFMLYRIPIEEQATPPVAYHGARPPSALFIAIPLAIILIAWVILERPTSEPGKLSRRNAPGGPPASGAPDET